MPLTITHPLRPTLQLSQSSSFHSYNPNTMSYLFIIPSLVLQDITTITLTKKKEKKRKKKISLILFFLFLFFFLVFFLYLFVGVFGTLKQSSRVCIFVFTHNEARTLFVSLVTSLCRCGSNHSMHTTQILRPLY